MDIRIKFGYGGKECEDKLDVINTESFRKGVKTVTNFECLHKESGTKWKVVRTGYSDFAACEWTATVYAEKDTDVFDDISWNVFFEGECGKLIGNYGDYLNDFTEYEHDITKEPIIHRALDGRPTHVYFPYYRIETDKIKTFAVLSWQGAWETEFTAYSGGVRMRGCQYGIHTVLKAGESFRLPTLLLLPYRDDPTNTWRHFYLGHIIPTVNGNKPRPVLGAFNGQCEGLTQDNVDTLRKLYDDNGIDYDFWWFDAGWGTDGTGPHNKCDKWFHGVNTEINREAFPDGLHAFGKTLRQKGKDFMLWFEPELIRTPREHWEEFFAAHPDFDRKWVLSVCDYEGCGTTLTAQMLDLGNDDCRKWLLGKVFDVMDNACVNIYRQDFNIEPYNVWRNADAADRKGFSENRYCTGLLKYYEAIRARYGDILMDSCASGGGRCDLDTMRLMVPFHNTDRQDVYPDNFNSHIHTQQIFWRWFPYTKNWLSVPAVKSDYGARSVMNSCLVIGIRMALAENVDFARMRECIAEWRSLSGLYLADYYELEKPSRDDVHIKAFEFFSPEQGVGFALVFAPDNCKTDVYRVLLRGLDRDKNYTVADKDSGKLWTGSGKMLRDGGFELPVARGKAYILHVEDKTIE